MKCGPESESGTQAVRFARVADVASELSERIPHVAQVLPEAPPDLVSELSRRYILLYETITGQTFRPAPLDESPAERMDRAVMRALERL